MDLLARVSGLFWCKIYSLNRPPGEVVTEVCYECPPAPSSASLYLALEIVLKRLENAQVSAMNSDCEPRLEHAEPNHISGDMAQIVTFRSIIFRSSKFWTCVSSAGDVDWIMHNFRTRLSQSLFFVSKLSLRDDTLIDVRCSIRRQISMKLCY